MFFYLFNVALVVLWQHPCTGSLFYLTTITCQFLMLPYHMWAVV